ncbi:lipopolysaccharide biosynthesis protein RfbH [Paenibacillus ferrarius]|uniref:Lipopolysaccharide biosynthesis protein RfbH n=1 Tax=Paenibacillus ferrarius TaxID=1469647 RepID=A0A1V4HGV4_9BACL|nr:lipopolysaccharide biosynthesis protein RfbH [Paenibacillus ferrarius]OPH54550.1 lipopolysaccharide biosynthesis protein RfbH [Paenibacillus ferrarius]
MSDDLRTQILSLVNDYYNEHHRPQNSYTTGNRIPYAGRVFDQEDMINLVDASLDFWLTAGRYTEEFEESLARYVGVRFCSLVNSGSSANLIAFMALTSPKLGERAIRRGDEVITVAAGFPTTVSPIIQFGAVPVFVDVNIPQYNIDCSQLKAALSDRTKAVMIAHTLGNPFNIAEIRHFCDEHKLWLIEDNCDALGTDYEMEGQWGKTGSFGDIATSSFYPPHHITMGEGGAVYTKNGLLHKIIRSFRDWGRDCWCDPGVDNTCGRRFNGQYGELPCGYDHKYVYSHFGYNLKVTDMQAAVGCSQLKKLPSFVDARIKNWEYLYSRLIDCQDKVILPEPAANSKPSWFGFLITVKEGISRNELVRYLEEQGIQTRMLFAGNLLKHPCFDEMRQEGKGYRVIGNLEQTDQIMNNTFWIGVYPGMTVEMLDYMANKIKQYLNEYSGDVA